MSLFCRRNTAHLPEAEKSAITAAGQRLSAGKEPLE
jgi:hypothetical protein